MQKDWELKGLDAVMKEINDQVDQIAGRTNAGLIEAVMFLHDKMQKEDPVIPIDTGYLRSSFFMVTANTKSVTPPAGTTIKTGVGSKTKTMKANLSSVNKAIVPTIQKSKGTKASKMYIAFGFSANYAIYVHENVGANFKSPTGPKFFEAHIKRNKDAVLKIIQKNAQITK